MRGTFYLFEHDLVCVLSSASWPWHVSFLVLEGLHHLNGLLSIITASMTLAKTQPRLLSQGAQAGACVTRHNSNWFRQLRRNKCSINQVGVWRIMTHALDDYRHWINERVLRGLIVCIDLDWSSHFCVTLRVSGTPWDTLYILCDSPCKVKVLGCQSLVVWVNQLYRWGLRALHEFM